MPISHIHIFGGVRGIGRWFAEHVFVGAGLACSVYDIDVSGNPQLPPGIAIHRLWASNEALYGLPTLGAGDAVVLAVPVSALPSLCASLFPRLPAGCLVVDMSSIKTEPHAIMEHHSAGRLSLLGIHPLFGPLVDSPVGQTVVLTGARADDARHAWLAEFLRARGCILEHTTPEQHDEHMLTIQVLTHFVLLTFARVLVVRQRPMAELLRLKTPPFTVVSAFAGRLLGGNALTYANIQRLAGATEIRAAMQEAAAELDAALSGDASAAVEAIRALGEPFRGTEISECVAMSNRLIESVQQLDQRLFALAESGALCGLRRTDTGKISVGVVREVQADRIVFEERARRVGDSEYYAVDTSDTARQNYRSMGVNFGKPRTFGILKRNARLLSDEELAGWLARYALPMGGDINVQAPAAFSATFYEEYLPRLVPGISGVLYRDAYAQPGGGEKVTLGITHSADITLHEAMMHINSVLRQMMAHPAPVQVPPPRPE
jgi:prephenate dehydrogenase